MERESFVFYRSFADALMELPDQNRLEAYDMIVRYALDGTEPEAGGIAKAMFLMAKPQIDANNKRYANGNKGGRPKGNQEETKEKPNNNQNITKVKPNENVNDNENVNVNIINTLCREAGAKDESGTVPYKDIIDYLNVKTGSHFRDNSKDTRSHIKARWNEGYRLEDFKAVIDKKASEWGSDSKMQQFLRPSTLFSPKFESYLNQKTVAKLVTKNQFHNFEQRDMDFDSLEAQLDRQFVGGS